MVRPDMYERICAGSDDSFAAGVALQELPYLRETPEGCALPAGGNACGMSRSHPWETVADDFAAALLNIGTATYPFGRSEAEDLTDELRTQGVLGRDGDDIEDFGTRWHSEITPETSDIHRDVSSTLARIRELRNDPPVERHDLIAALNLHLPSADGG